MGLPPQKGEEPCSGQGGGLWPQQRLWKEPGCARARPHERAAGTVEGHCLRRCFARAGQLVPCHCGPWAGMLRVSVMQGVQTPRGYGAALAQQRWCRQREDREQQSGGAGSGGVGSIGPESSSGAGSGGTGRGGAGRGGAGSMGPWSSGGAGSGGAGRGAVMLQPCPSHVHDAWGPRAASQAGGRGGRDAAPCCQPSACPLLPIKEGNGASPPGEVCLVLRAGDKVGEAGREGHGWARHGHAA